MYTYLPGRPGYNVYVYAVVLTYTLDLYHNVYVNARGSFESQEKNQ